MSAVKRNRPKLKDWLWPEVLSPLPKAIKKFRESQEDEDPYFKGLPLMPISRKEYYKFGMLVIAAFDPDLVTENRKLNWFVGNCISYRPDFSIFLMKFARKRLLDVLKNPVRSFLYHHESAAGLNQKCGGKFWPDGVPELEKLEAKEIIKLGWKDKFKSADAVDAELRRLAKQTARFHLLISNKNSDEDIQLTKAIYEDLKKSEWAVTWGDV